MKPMPQYTAAKADCQALEESMLCVTILSLKAVYSDCNKDVRILKF